MDVLTALKTAEAKTACAVWEAAYTAATTGDARTATWMIDKRWTDTPEPEIEELEDRASKMFQIGQAMRGAMPGPPA